MSGYDFWAYSHPLIQDVIIETMKEVKYPYDKNNQTFYDIWYPKDGSTRNTDLLPLNSDFGVFAHYYGIPSFRQTSHTPHDLNGWMEIIDPQW